VTCLNRTLSHFLLPINDFQTRLEIGRCAFRIRHSRDDRIARNNVVALRPKEKTLEAHRIGGHEFDSGPLGAAKPLIYYGPRELLILDNDRNSRFCEWFGKSP